MIICSCNVISDKELEEGIARLQATYPHRKLTAGMVYRSLGKSFRCKGCLPLAVQVVKELRQRGLMSLELEEGAAPVLQAV